MDVKNTPATKQDIGGIAEAIQDLTGMVAERFERVDERFEKIDERFDRIELRLTSVENTVEHIDTRLGRVENKLDATILLVDDHAIRVKKLEQKAA